MCKSALGTRLDYVAITVVVKKILFVQKNLFRIVSQLEKHLKAD